MRMLTRRNSIRTGLAAGAALAAPAVARAATEIAIGFWPIAAGLPLYAGIAKGVFAKAGLDVKGAQFASAQLVMEGMLAGRLQGSANGTASGIVGLTEIAKPGLCKIICANPSNVKAVLDEFVVAKTSPFQKMTDLKGKRIASGPGIQNVLLAKICLEKNGYPDAKVVELPLPQHVPSLKAGQIDAAYTLEPVGTLGDMQGITRTIATGVISTYVLGNPDAPWFGGAACLTAPFIKAEPELTKRYVAAYADSVALVRQNPDAMRPYLVGNTPITEELAAKVPLPDFTLWNEFTASDLDYFQKFFDVFTTHGVYTEHVDVRGMMYHG